LICPGGGYSILAMDLKGEEAAAWLNSIGVTGIVLKSESSRLMSDVEGGCFTIRRLQGLPESPSKTRAPGFAA
jgi:hypothetical protein